MNPPTPVHDGRDPQPLAAYLRELRWALGALPEADRNEIVAEARSHLLDRLEGGAAIEAAIAGLGTPRDYARPFVEDYRQSTALAHGRTRDLLPVLLERIATSARAAGSVALLLLLWAPALALLGTAIVKLSHPQIAGLWVGPKHFFIGTIDDPTVAHEVLGFWIFPLAVVALVVAWLLTRKLTSSAVRRLGPQR
ncbi:MAG TPA: hypothetical protein VF017_09460 [Thermoanaerobaculia bacterium]|nr:hypothetical protein [Thermoanaerobaculia bacterium]